MYRFARLSFFSFLFVLVSGCSGCSSVAGPGETCDIELDEPCEEEMNLVCMAAEDGEDRCLHPAGEICHAEDDACAPESECVEVDEDEWRCLITEGGSCHPDEDWCADGLRCEEMEDGGHQCHQEVVVQGVVFDAETLAAIEGAHVIGFDDERRALSDVAVTDAEGEYQMTVPAVRDEDGVPIQQFFTLRASAQDYQTFPGGIRQAQPIDISQAGELDDQWVIDTTQTDIALLELPEGQRGYPHISGTVDIDDGLGGVLVVAEPQGVDPEESEEPVGFSAVSGVDGSFTIFNVPPDSYDVRGYLGGVQIVPEEVTMSDQNVEDVILTESSEGLRDVSGTIQIVRTSGETSVLLISAATFDEMTVRGEAPAGLRAPETGPGNISNDGEWTIEGVPAGKYVVMAAYEMDGLVRSPDEGIAGTDIIHIEVPEGSGEFDVGDSFKVTLALQTYEPGAEGPEAVTDAPVLAWHGDITNADHYDV